MTSSETTETSLIGSFADIPLQGETTPAPATDARPRRRTFSAEFKRRIVKEADAALASGQEGAVGELLLQGKRHLEAPWLGLTGFFTVAIMLSLLIFIGEAVRDALDPRKTFR